jgi:hypothetical protein
MDAMENLSLLRGKRLVKEVTEKGAEAFVEDFRFVVGWMDLYDEVREKEGGEGEGEEEVMLREIFPRSVGEVKVLLS